MWPKLNQTKLHLYIDKQRCVDKNPQLHLRLHMCGSCRNNPQKMMGCRRNRQWLLTEWTDTGAVAEVETESSRVKITKLRLLRIAWYDSLCALSKAGLGFPCVNLAEICDLLVGWLGVRSTRGQFHFYMDGVMTHEALLLNLFFFSRLWRCSTAICFGHEPKAS